MIKCKRSKAVIHRLQKKGDSMKRNIITDSSSDLTSLKRTPLSVVPLKIITDEKQYIDDGSLDSVNMLSELEKYKGRSRSSCPNPDEYLEAFGEADEVFCVTITSGLSGSYNSAAAAAKMFEQSGDDKRALVIDSLSTGPESALILEKIEELTESGLSFDEINEKIGEYQKHTHLIFSLESLTNLARNGRVSSIVAKICGVLGIRVIGKASDVGTLEVTNKARGERNAIKTVLENMKKTGYTGGRVKIHHANNEGAALLLKSLILEEFSEASIDVQTTGGLCSFYAEKGGVLVGYEA